MKKSLVLFLIYIFPVYAQNSLNRPPPKEALLIANGDYTNFGKLPNPVTDARLLAQSLHRLGFQVTLLENQSREGMLDALNSFQDRLKSNNGLAFFHYGGHGIQVDGRNFLIPVDADIPDERKVTTRALDLEEVMTTMDASGSHVNVVILDACRDNPLPTVTTRSASRGLSVIQTKPKNSLIVYAAEPGKKAVDGLFTPTLAKEIVSHGKSLSQIFKDVRKQVYKISNGKQTPGEYDQLFEDVYLSGEGDRPESTQNDTKEIEQTLYIHEEIKHRRPDEANVFWFPNEPLNCLQCQKEILPHKFRGAGEMVFEIWYSCNEDPSVNSILIKKNDMPNFRFYKFCSKSCCSEWVVEKNKIMGTLKNSEF